MVGVDGCGKSGDDAPVDVLTDVLRVRARAAAVADAGLLEAVVAVADRDPVGFDADLVAFSLHWTQAAARAQVEFGRYLQRVIKPVWAAMCAGELDVPRARVFHDVLAPVDDDVAFAIALELVDRAAGWTTGQLRQRLRRAVCRADPHGAGKRTAASVAGRRVCLTPQRDATASLLAMCLPAARAVAAFERVDAFARARRTGGDPRTLDQLRADTVLDLLEGVQVTQAPVFRRGVVEITVPWATLAGGIDQPHRVNRQTRPCAGSSTSLGTADSAGHAGDKSAMRAADDQAATGRGTDAADTGDGHGADSGGIDDGHGTHVAATGGGGEPAMLAGFGPLDTHTARGVVDSMLGRRDVQWRLRVHGESGDLRGLGPLPAPRDQADLTDALRDIVNTAAVGPPSEANPRRRRPGPALSRWIRARDGTCTAPGCRVPASVCDIDSTLA